MRTTNGITTVCDACPSCGVFLAFPSCISFRYMLSWRRQAAGRLETPCWLHLQTGLSPAHLPPQRRFHPSNLVHVNIVTLVVGPAGCSGTSNPAGHTLSRFCPHFQPPSTCRSASLLQALVSCDARQSFRYHAAREGAAAPPGGLRGQLPGDDICVCRPPCPPFYGRTLLEI